MKNLTGERDGEVTLYAQWAAHSYEVRFDANGGEGEMADQAFAYDAAQRLARNAFSRTGYDFAGWRCGDATYADGQEVKNLAAEAGATVTLVAQWAPHSYSVAFDRGAADATGDMPDQAFAYGTAQQLTANAFTRTAAGGAATRPTPTGRR